MLDKLNAELRGIVEPFVNRWKTFEGKLTGRAQEIENEANAGLDELVKMNPLDPNAISAGFNAVKARLQGLGDKIDSAIEKIEEEWEEATEDLELEEDQYPLLSQVWFGIVRDSRALQHKLEKWHEGIEVKKNADWARLLFNMAQEECGKPHSCPSCGAGIDVTIQHAASAVKCPHCDSVNEINVGPATGYYYQGNGVHALAQEAVFEKFMAQIDAERDYNEWRHPTDDDRKKYLGVVAAYWTAYYEATQGLHPGFKQTVEEAVKGRLAHYAQYDNAQDQSDRAFYGELLRLAAARDEAGLMSHLEGAEDLDECPSAVHEHGDRDGTILVLKAVHKLEDEDDSLKDYIKEKLTDLDQDLATR
jgi:hypothetical protein